MKYHNSDELETSGFVSSVKNKIFFCGEISNESMMDLVYTIQEMDNDTRSKRIPIELHINSPGGDFQACLFIYGVIRRCVRPIHTYIDGLAGSAATILALTGQKRFMSKHSNILIHQIRSGFYGKWNDLKDEKQNVECLMDSMASIYLERTKMTKKSLNNIIHRELYLKAEEALDYGFIHEII